MAEQRADNGSRWRHPGSPSGRGGNLDLTGLSRALAAWDAEKRRGAPPICEDLAQTLLLCSQILDALEGLSRAVPEEARSSLAELCRRFKEALEILVREAEAKLATAEQPDQLKQGLRRLAAALSACEVPAVSIGGEDPLVGSFLQLCHGALGLARGVVPLLLKERLGLEMMADQTGARLDPRLHQVLGTEPVDDPGAHDTVVRQEAPGWLLHGEVLTPAEVIRGVAREGQFSVASGTAEGIDEARLGRRRER